MVIDHDGTRNRQIETRHETPLRDLDDELCGVEEFLRDAPDFGAEKKARSLRVRGLEEIGRGFVQFHRNEIPIVGLEMGQESSGFGGQLDDFGVEIRRPRGLDVPLAFAEQNDLARSHRVRGANQSADVVLFGNLPRRNGKGAQTKAVLIESPGPAVGAPLSHIIIFGRIHAFNLTLQFSRLRPVELLKCEIPRLRDFVVAGVPARTFSVGNAAVWSV